MRIHYRQVLGSLAAGLMIVTAPAYAAPREKGAAKAQQIDLRAATKQMSWKEGSNLVHRGAGVKLMAEVKGGKVVRWTATDDKGKPLSVQMDEYTCEICITKHSQNGPDLTWCYKVDCKTIPPLPKARQ